MWQGRYSNTLIPTNKNSIFDYETKPFMLSLLLKIYKDRFISRWSVLFIDSIATLIALIAAILIRFNFSIDSAQRVLNVTSFIGVLTVYSLIYTLIGSHRGILRHTSLDDVKRVIKSTFFGFLATIIISISGDILIGMRLFPLSVLVFHFTITLFALITLRLAVKSIYIAGTKNTDNTQRVLIFGCGDCGIMTKQALQRDQQGKFSVIAFTDDNSSLFGKKLQNVPIYNSNIALDKEWLHKKHVDLIVIAISSITQERKRKILESALSAGIEVKTVPTYRNWIDGNMTTNQLKKIKIDDLLQRTAIELDNVNIQGNCETAQFFQCGETRAHRSRGESPL